MGTPSSTMATEATLGKKVETALNKANDETAEGDHHLAAGYGTGLRAAESVEQKIKVIDEQEHWGIDAMPLPIQKMLAEFIGMTLFVFLGPSSAINGGDTLQIALTFGFAIFVLACAIGHTSGGQMNCAVTLALVITGDVTPLQGVLNFIGQLFGSISGAFLLWAVYPCDMDSTNSLGSNIIATGYEPGNAVIGEILMTFLLCFVVLECAINPKSKQSTTCLAIGMPVFLAHSALIAVDGCSINPTRSVGPAIVASIRYESEDYHNAPTNNVPPYNIWENHWVFWVGPLTGAALAGLMSRLWWHPGNWQYKVAKPKPEEPVVPEEPEVAQPKPNAWFKGEQL